MPYIEANARAALRPACASATTPGELNFQISVLVDRYLQSHGVSYGTINEAVGVLECMKLEAYARIARPYEDIKIATNGEVFSVIEGAQANA